MLGLVLGHQEGTTTHIKVEMAVTDYPWGSEWQAAVRSARQPPPFPDSGVIRVRLKTTYGAVLGERRADTREVTIVRANGQQVGEKREGRLRLAKPRPQVSAEEFQQRFAQFAAGEAF